MIFHRDLRSLEDEMNFKLFFTCSGNRLKNNHQSIETKSKSSSMPSGSRQIRVESVAMMIFVFMRRRNITRLERRNTDEDLHTCSCNRDESIAGAFVLIANRLSSQVI